MANNYGFANVNKTNAVTLDKRITLAIRNANGSVSEIHDVALECLAHFVKLGSDERPCWDISKFATLAMGMPLATRSALCRWACHFMPIKANFTKDAKTGASTFRIRKDRSDDAKTPDLAGAAANPFHSLGKTAKPKADKPFTITDANKAFDRLVARLDKALEDGEIEDGAETAIRNRIAAYKAFAKAGYAVVTKAPAVAPVEGVALAVAA